MIEPNNVTTNPMRIDFIKNSRIFMSFRFNSWNAASPAAIIPPIVIAAAIT